LPLDLRRIKQSAKRGDTMDGVGLSLSASTFEDIGLALIGSKRGSLKIRNRCYIAHFGMKPGLVAVIWRELVQSGWIKLLHVRPPKPEHLLWTLLFLNNYSVEEIHSSWVQCCETTFRKWAWFYAEGIASLDQKSVRCQH
jgi:hypothetical protein